ncbi:homeobox-leucine zipper protein HAT5 [Cryptomeria japonica]|uniref:homeobox-leucine zipper protein HAT5 n=1 Tax=Cryptomeria japonica TaxID=3369 RepID=UPI0027DAB0D1|nr:homeobox-leucine zipper protein HAT5 [Cryptomeria japonica]XP_057839538.2 homeobox-leucine zipper protein HAT5 [Cryptomeria japonica]XP_057839539.2 homeobox-leucine zipper protein HAT5 [Cryptomeria japonica]XP_057839540.2 homeobox-leucine zipper protein HAT5 [Cryptomeria japonica]
MACDGRAFYSPNIIMKSEDSSANSIAAMIAVGSCTPPATFQGNRSLGAFDSGSERKILGKCRSFSALDMSEDLGDEDGSDDSIHLGEKKRRLTFEQVRALEKNFEVTNKLEPEKKIQLARALGLQPRQIAVWFQNRRARWKTKQLERDFDVLKQDHDSLKKDFDNLVEENRNLQAMVQRLRGKLMSSQDQKSQLNSSLMEENELPVPMLSGTADNVNTNKENEGPSSIGSEASSVLNIDSPGTIDSQQNNTIDSAMKTCVAYPQCSIGIRPKVEENLNQADEPNFNLFYSNLEEAGALWWEYWPQTL